MGSFGADGGWGRREAVGGGRLGRRDGDERGWGADLERRNGIETDSSSSIGKGSGPFREAVRNDRDGPALEVHLENG